jgi:hypothetical protein
MLRGRLGPACGMAVGQDGRVHGTGGRARDGVDTQPRLLEQPINTPQLKVPCAPRSYCR